MEIISFTLIAVLLYIVSDWLVNRIESRRQERLEHRTLVFFAIILILAMATFSLIGMIQQGA